MSANLAPWALFATFVAGLVATVLVVVRALITGRLVPRLTHADVLKERDGWRTAYETTAAANAKHADNEADLVTAVERLAVAQQETNALVRSLVPATGRDAA